MGTFLMSFQGDTIKEFQHLKPMLIKPMLMACWAML
jgi:hypothetical protein